MVDINKDQTSNNHSWLHQNKLKFVKDQIFHLPRNGTNVFDTESTSTKFSFLGHPPDKKSKGISVYILFCKIVFLINFLLLLKYGKPNDTLQIYRTFSIYLAFTKLAEIPVCRLQNDSGKLQCPRR